MSSSGTAHPERSSLLSPVDRAQNGTAHADLSDASISRNPNPAHPGARGTTPFADPPKLAMARMRGTAYAGGARRNPHVGWRGHLRRVPQREGQYLWGDRQSRLGRGLTFASMDTPSADDLARGIVDLLIELRAYRERHAGPSAARNPYDQESGASEPDEWGASEPDEWGQ